MNSLLRVLCLGNLSLLACLALSMPVRAQSVEPTVTEESASSLWIEPRYSIDYNSSGGGYDGFGGLELFLPFQQEPGNYVRYFVGRVNLTNDADVGGNLLVGSRSLGDCLIVQGQCLFGGYLGFDFTNTGESFFTQFGVGAEMLGDLDVRLNGYLPLGDTHQTVEAGQVVSPTGVEFQGNHLVFLDFNHPGRAEVALSGFDAEVGGQLLPFGNSGVLRGYGGVYNYGGEEVDRYWGGRFRLEARPTDYLSLSGGIQFDEEFGTNLLFQVRASFGNRYQQGETEAAPIYDRMADPLGRLNSVVVTERVIPSTEVAINPTTGNTQEFIHVNPDAGNSNGTVEDPFSTVAEAIAVAIAPDIIYVQPGNAGSGFTIPDGVAVLSTAPMQRVETQYGTVPIPGSGQGEGTRPLITDTVTMGHDTVLSGFDIQPPVDRLGIVAENVGNIEIAHNRLRVVNTLSYQEFSEAFPSGFAGILVRQEATAMLGAVTITDNTVDSINDYEGVLSRFGPSYQNIVGIDVVGGLGTPIAIANNIVTTQGNDSDGVIARSNGGPVTVTDNIVITEGVASDSIISSSNGGSVAITGNAVDLSGDGIFACVGFFGFFICPLTELNGIAATSTENGSALIADNVVNTQGDGARGIVGSSSGSSSFAIADNSINTSGGRTDGLQNRRYDVGSEGIVGTSDGTSQMTIAGNLINTGGEVSEGIVGISTGLSRMTIEGNTVSTSGNGSEAILGRSANDSQVTISGNTVSTRGGSSPGLFAPDYSDVDSEGIVGVSADNSTTTIFGNTISTSGEQAAGIFARSTGNGSTTVFDNAIATQGEAANGIRGEAGHCTTIVITFPFMPDTFQTSCRSGGSVTILDNTIATLGEAANGILGGSRYSNHLEIASNRIEASGNDGVRFEIERDPDEFSLACLTLRSNISQKPGSGIGYRLINNADFGDFQIVDSSPAFADTQTSNIGTFSFEPNISSFTNVPACLQN